MKELLEENIFKEDDFYLDNLSEKIRPGYYIDAPWEVKNISSIFNDIANDLTEKTLAYKFDKEDLPGMHPFLNCEGKFVKKLGLNSVTICPYKGYPHVEWLDSNYMVMGGTVRNLTIDIYNTVNLDKKKIYELIITELFNFKRDLEWVVEGIYEERMNDMKIILNNFGMIGEA